VTPDAIRDAERKQDAAGEAAERASLVRAQALEAKLVADRRKSTNRYFALGIIHSTTNVHMWQPAIIPNTKPQTCIFISLQTYLLLEQEAAAAEEEGRKRSFRWVMCYVS